MSEIIIIKKNVECGPRVKKVAHPWSKHQLSKTSTVQNINCLKNLLSNHQPINNAKLTSKFN